MVKEEKSDKPKAKETPIVFVVLFLAYFVALRLTFGLVCTIVYSLYSIYRWIVTLPSTVFPKRIDLSFLEEKGDTDGETHCRVCVIGAGFSGLCAAIQLQKSGLKAPEIVVLERAAALGGTWRDNIYPGVACDIPSNVYSYSFFPNPNWSRDFSPGKEIWDYLENAADHFNVRRFIKFNSEVTSCVWIDDRKLWKVTTKRRDLAGKTEVLFANFVFNAQGPLAEPKIPKIDGLQNFKGKVMHTAQWDPTYDLEGKRVAVIGCGSSVIQALPIIQGIASSVVHFQRTPSWVTLHPNFTTPRFMRAVFRFFPFVQALLRGILYFGNEMVGMLLVYNVRFLRHFPLIFRAWLQYEVRDPVLREKLTPNFEPGCKRLLFSDTYYKALQQPNVKIVFAGLTATTETSVIGADGSEHEVDVIIFGTGFLVVPEERREVTFPIVGKNNMNMAQCTTKDVMERSYLGVVSRDFPNLFFSVGPNTGLGSNTIILIIECQVDYMIQALLSLSQRRSHQLEVLSKPALEFNKDCQKKLGSMVWNRGGCKSWYLDKDGINITIYPGLPSQYYFQAQFKPAEFEWS